MDATVLFFSFSVCVSLMVAKCGPRDTDWFSVDRICEKDVKL